MKKVHSTQCCTTNQLNPEVFISVRKNRIKSHIDVVDDCSNTSKYESRVYLQNGTEFQLEFHNNTTINQKAEIWINGKLQNDALVLRPGEHFYLDRFMDKDRKLKFDVYEVDNNSEVKEIIENNGRIEVRFFKEYIAPIVTWTYHNVYPYTGTPWYYDYRQYTSPQYTDSASTSKFTSYSKQRTSKATTQFFGTINTCCSNVNSNDDAIETGRVAQGEKSNQDFVSVDKTFDYFPNTIIKYHILPISQQSHEISTREFRDYCPSCGRRIKRGWVHCAGCGEKI